MKVLIVEWKPELGRLWARHLERVGATVDIAMTEVEAIDMLRETAFDAVVLDLTLPEGSALAVADFAAYRRPNARIVFVTNTTFFSDGSIFALSTNARAFLQSDMPPEDLAAIVQYHAAAR
jgi:CheY-like chemotaxis protein